MLATWILTLDRGYCHGNEKGKEKWVFVAIFSTFLPKMPNLVPARGNTWMITHAEVLHWPGSANYYPELKKDYAAKVHPLMIRCFARNGTPSVLQSQKGNHFTADSNSNLEILHLVVQVFSNVQHLDTQIFFERNSEHGSNSSLSIVVG